MAVLLATLVALGGAFGVRNAAEAHAKPTQPTAGASARQPAARHDTQKASPKLVQVNPSGLLWLPRSCIGTEEPLDVIFHFHGVPHIVKSAAEGAGLDVVVSVHNEGELSASYKRAWSSPRAFEALLSEARAGIRDYCGADEPRVGRVALSSFSAGFAAVQQLLDRPPVFARVDAVLLEDSLYAAYTNPSTEAISTHGLAPFVAVGRAALDGEKLLAITHSAIKTPNYASTVETADYLLQKLGVERHATADGSGTEARRGSFWLLGRPGRDASAHAKHLQGMGATVLARLAERWHSPASAP